jgi:hypothetical protein
MYMGGDEVGGFASRGRGDRQGQQFDHVHHHELRRDVLRVRVLS